ncbi:hypothetical protein FOXB_12837 [Fusarium oxysporum f. sp. conglutinans Fo5176]|uniref:Uncharacterized protein n=1 Tax=Fusarium oxysporum (strain Fo5176) TaxID=660025 RepID=F9G2F5_FUSOF|nr:hypothetical protein FOXB_12837 [Fusarium oxysporum f. sp. conglutinans Fo5176]
MLLAPFCLNDPFWLCNLLSAHVTEQAMN